jgi:hypothetical protein
MARQIGRVAIIVVLVLVPTAAAAIGYYLGSRDRSAATPTTYPTWTDQQVVNVAAGSGAIRLYLRCTYHVADGSTRVRDYPYVDGVTSASPAQVRSACPAIPE